MSVIWKDGQFLDGTLPQMFHDDCAIAGGLGIFDSLLAINGVLQDPLEHYERILHDAHIVLGLNESWNPSLTDMTAIWQPLLSENNLQRGHARIRTVITGGMSQGPLIPSATPTVLVTAGKTGSAEELPSVTCMIVKDFPRVAGCRLENCKRLDYTRSFAARQVAKENGAQEAILINTNGHVACGATSNIFIREEENAPLLTPPLSDGVLAGVTRRKLLESGKAREESLSEERVRNAAGIYLGNSFVGLRKISEIIA